MPSRLAVRTLLRQRLALLLMAVALPAAAILPLLPSLPASASSTPTLLGEQSFYTLDRHQLWDKADLAVNVASGDLIFHEKDLGIPGIGANHLVLERYYNSLSNGAGGGADFGSGWVMTAGGDVKLTIVAGVSATYQGPSSFQQVFPANGSAWTTPAGMDATLVGPAGGNYTLTYHNNGQVLTFNGTGQLLSNADRNGNAIAYAYNTDGTLHQITDAAGRTVSFTYNGGGNVATMVDYSLGRTYTYAINGSHNLTGYSDPVTPVTTAVFTYDTTGKHELTDITDPAATGHTHLVYDTNHRVTELDFTKDGSGGIYKRLYAYNSGITGSRCDSSLSPAGNTVVTDENTPSHNTDYCWDSSGRVIEMIDGAGNKTITIWNSDDKPTSITDPNGPGHATTYAYADPTYPNELVTSVTQATGAVTSYTYGASTNHSAPTTVVEPNGNRFTNTYDSNGNRNSSANGLGSQNSVYSSNYLNGNVYGVLDAVGDANPNCGAVGDPYTQCFGYDARGAIAVRYNPSPQGTDHYVNDAASRVSTHTDSNSQVTNYFYDAADRVTKILYGGTTSCQTQTVNCTTFTYDADGNLKTMQDQTGTTTFTYDKLNRMSSQAESLTGSQTCTTNPLSCTTYTRDGVGNITQIVNGLGATKPINYAYDPANRLQNLWTGTAASCSASLATCTQFGYDAAGNRQTTSYPNNVTMTAVYDHSERLTSLSSAHLSTAISNWSYTYTSPGSQDTNLRYTATQSVTPTSGGPNSYNVMDNLTLSQSQSSAYDPKGNICGASCGSGQSMQYGLANNLANWNGNLYNYDLDGNLMRPGFDGGSIAWRRWSHGRTPTPVPAPDPASVPT